MDSGGLVWGKEAIMIVKKNKKNNVFLSSKLPQSRVRWEKLRGTVSQSIRFNQYFFRT